MSASAISMLASGHLDGDVLESLSREIALVEEELAEQVRSQVSTVCRVGSLTLGAGGKRLRPAFVSLAAQATGLSADPVRMRKLGACMELIHMATLIHDDVIDNAATRRGHATAATEFGNTASILSGDVLLARAMVLLAQDGDLKIIRTVSAAVVEMAEGEVRELEVRGVFDLDEAAHLEVLRLKTASFIECCCKVGALIADAPEPMEQGLATFGYHVGMAFQVVDDLLDYRGDKQRTGKPLATDFREGQATLPLIYLRDKLSDAEISMAQRKFGNGVTDDEIRMISDWMDTRGAFAQAEERAQSHIESALAALEPLPEGPAKRLLTSVGAYVLMRQA